jgi:Bacterial Ig domain/Domain of unknown function (DUF4114)/RTX calcium-binding nonapeptide repeat (4 copies)
MADPEVTDGWQHLAQAEGAGASGEAAPEAGRAANRPPQAADVCVATAEDAPVGVPVLASVSDPDGDPQQLLAATGPTSGEVASNPDGTVTYTPDVPGLQSFRYHVSDGQGGVAHGNVAVLVNPADRELDRPVLAGLDDQELAMLARACAAGSALEVATLTGPEVVVRPPDPGTRVQVRTEPGQSIELAGGEFASATYIVVEGGLLVVTEDGRLVYLSGFVDSATSGPPPTLAVAGGAPVPADQLLADLQPIGAPAEQLMVARLVAPAAGPEHGGGAGFSPYDPGDLGPGLGLTGPLLPTALGPRPEFLLRAIGESGEGEQAGGPPPINGNRAPTLSADDTIERELGGITVTPQFASAGPFAALGEAVRLPDAQINGVDQRNLMLGQSGEAAIVFNSEFAAFVNTLGVYLIDRDGQLVDPKIVFAQIEQAEGDPNFPSVRPGGGPVAAGDQVLLSALYDSSQLQPGQEFGLFMIADGFRLNDDLRGADLVFASDGHTLLTADGQPIAGNVFFTADPTPDSPNDNPLNPDGLGHVVSGLLPDHSGLTIGFEDKLLSERGDNDFNDVLVDIELGPTVQAAFAGGALHVVIDATVTDPDDADLSQASVELLNPQPGDALAFDGSLAGTGINLVTSTPTSLVFQGTASIRDYVELLASVVLNPAPLEGVRQIGLSVVDAQGAASNAFVVNANLSATNAEPGTPGDDVLNGMPLVDDAISGFGGDDVLSGDSGNDLLDGGLGNDILDGGDGDDQLIGGPGVDRLSGGPGADSQIYVSLAERGDEIQGFNANDGDTLDFSQLLQGATASTIDDFVQFAPVGNDVAVSVDVDGPGSSFASVPFLTLADPTGVTTAQAAADNGSLVV